MSIRRPSPTQVSEIAATFGMRMSETESAQYAALMDGNLAAYDAVASMPDELPEVRFPRTPGNFPPSEENSLNAWYVKSVVQGVKSGPLSGRTIVLKDNVCLAGVPMMNGASTLEGYVPEIDATVVTRILEAGGTIVGKAHCEFFCCSGGSHTNAIAPVRNPHDPERMAGGSSSGSAALVAAGEVDMAIGGDQGGSIRMPSSYSGTVGMKPTHGLVPYSGIMPIEPTIDHAGPITANVIDNALLLSVIAGADDLDPRQYAPKVGDYLGRLKQGIDGLKIGVVSEGFGTLGAEPDVDIAVRNAANRLIKAGANVEEVSVPMHAAGMAIWSPIAIEGLTWTMMHGNGFGSSRKDLYITSLMERHSGWRQRADELSPSLKVLMLVGEYMRTTYHGRYLGKAYNLNRRLTAGYDAALERYDALLMPTTPMKAQPIPPDDAPIPVIVQRAFEMLTNTAPFDATGHPAISVPCAMSEGLPVGMMLVGRHYDEATLYALAQAFEDLGDWRQAN